MNVRPCVSVVIVTYESAAHIGRCLTSLRDTAAGWLQDVIIIDNASTDGTADLIAREFPDVKLMRNSSNAGFGRAMNQGVRLATGEYLLILNPDCTIKPAAVGELAHFLDHRPQAASSGPMLLSEQGEYQYSSRRGFPTPLNSIGYFLGLDRLFPHSRALGGYLRRYVDPRQEVMTDSLSGACMLVRRDAFEQVGGFDEDYFLFGDDIDLCWKLREAGHEVWYVPSAQVMHVKGASMRKHPRVAQREFYRSMHLFIDKRLRGRYSPISLSIAKVGVIAAELWTKLRGGR
jgi:GT2 family glycosyltransferase